MTSETTILGMNVQPLTLDQAKALRPGNTLYCLYDRDSRGYAKKVKVNGQPKTWKRSPDRVRIPYKYGLYGYGYIGENDLDQFSLDEPERINPTKAKLNG